METAGGQAAPGAVRHHRRRRAECQHLSGRMRFVITCMPAHPKLPHCTRTAKRIQYQTSRCPFFSCLFCLLGELRPQSWGLGRWIGDLPVNSHCSCFPPDSVFLYFIRPIANSLSGHTQRAS